MNHYIKFALLILLISLSVSSCRFSSPKFKHLNAWQIEKVGGTEFRLSNTAVFYNPNSFGGINLSDIDLTVSAHGKNIGTITNAEPKVNIAANSDFSVPLSLTINPLDLISGLGNLIGLVTKQSVDLRVQGRAKAGYGIFKRNIPINYTQPIKLSDIQK